MLLQTYSVVIPIYNSSHTIERTLLSIAKQRFLPEEVILVDDCSNVADIIEVKNIINRVPLVCKLIQKSNKTNAANSRNIGWNNSNSKYVFFLDSDDEWLEEHVTNVLQIFKDGHKGCVYSNFVVDYGTGETRTHRLEKIRQGDFSAADFLFSRGNDFRTSTLALDNCIYDIAKFDDTCQKHQDWDFLMELNKHSISISFNSLLDVKINAFGEHRMSSKLNLNATKSFLDKWSLDLGRANLNAFYWNCQMSALANNSRQEAEKLEELFLEYTRIDNTKKIILFLYKTNPYIFSFLFVRSKKIKVFLKGIL